MREPDVLRMLIVGDNFVTDGEEIVIDGTFNIEYAPLCGSCYLERVKKIDLKSIAKTLRR